MIYLPSSGRVVLAGGPRVGKTTLAKAMLERGFRVRHADDLKDSHAWSAASEEVSRWFGDPGPWIVEGVAAVRALRKWLKANPSGAPCDVVAWLDRAKVERSPGQEAMAKGCATVWAEVLPELLRRGVEVQHQER